MSPDLPRTNDPRLSEAKRKLLELQMRRGATTAASEEFKIRSPELPIPLSLAQEQVWRLDQTAGKLAPLHNESITLHRHGPCDPAIVERCLAEIIRRHEIWRTTYKDVSGRPVQIIHPAASSNLPVSDLRHLSAADREQAAQNIADEDARQPFDLERGPLVRMRLITLEDNEHRHYLNAHQSVVDGITVFDIFPTEFTTIYESFAAGQPSPLPELELQFANFASWQRRRMTGEACERQLAYWQKQLAADLPPLAWPNNGTRPAQQTYRGAMHSFTFSSALSQSLKDLARREGSTLFVTLLSALTLLLHRYTKQDDIVIGTLSPSGRKQTEFQRLLGYFLNPVALRANLRGNPAFSALLRQMREVTFGAISHDDVTLDQIAERIQLKPDPSRHPFFTVAFSLAPDVAPLPSGWRMTYMDVESSGARWDLYIEMSDRAEGLLGRAQYNPDLFTAESTAQTIEDYRRLLEEVTTGMR